jgi:hypothetical protein
MSTSSLPDTSSVRAAINNLLAEKAPVLVEVRFPQMGTSSDWFLCEDTSELDSVLERLGPGAEAHVSSVWDLRDSTGGAVMRK